MLQVEAALDPTKDLSRLISDRKYEEAFTAALQRSDLSIVSWLCSQVCLRYCVLERVSVSVKYFTV